jgi:hypothetical protein
MARTPRERNRIAAENIESKTPTQEQQGRVAAITKAALSFAKVVIKNTEDTPAATLAQRDIERAKRQAVAAVFAGTPASDGASAPTKRVAKKAAPPAKKATGGVRKAVKRASD